MLIRKIVLKTTCLFKVNNVARDDRYYRGGRGDRDGYHRDREGRRGDGYHDDRSRDYRGEDERRERDRDRFVDNDLT